MRRFDYYAGVLILAAALFFGQMAASRSMTAAAKGQPDAKAADVVTAHALRIVDRQGKLRAEIQASDTGSALTLLTPDGATDTGLAQNADGSMVLVGADRNNTPGLTLSAGNRGAALALTGAQGTSIKAETNGATGRALISVRNPDAETTLPGAAPPPSKQ